MGKVKGPEWVHVTHGVSYPGSLPFLVQGIKFFELAQYYGTHTAALVHPILAGVMLSEQPKGITI